MRGLTTAAPQGGGLATELGSMNHWQFKVTTHSQAGLDLGCVDQLRGPRGWWLVQTMQGALGELEPLLWPCPRSEHPPPSTLLARCALSRLAPPSPHYPTQRHVRDRDLPTDTCLWLRHASARTSPRDYTPSDRIHATVSPTLCHA